jgi:acetyl esterase/lipase
MSFKRICLIGTGMLCMSAALMFPVAQALAQAPATTVVPLWPNGAPGSESRRSEPEIAKDYYVTNVHAPSLTVMKADPRHANGAAIIVVPGGGHRILVMQSEGIAAAKILNRLGVSVFVLKYRLARDPGSGYSIECDAAGDLRRAVRWVRANAAQYGVDPHRLGVMGFSAGGELVSMVADNPAAGAPAGTDPIDRQSARPDFQVLIYPGPLGIPAKAVQDAPPAFFVAGSLDKCCATPAITLYQQLVGAGVSAELHMYAETDHAFNMAQQSERISILHWPDRLADWLGDGGWLIPHAGGQAPKGVIAPTPSP